MAPPFCVSAFFSAGATSSERHGDTAVHASRAWIRRGNAHRSPHAHDARRRSPLRRARPASTASPTSPSSATSASSMPARSASTSRSGSPRCRSTCSFRSRPRRASALSAHATERRGVPRAVHARPRGDVPQPRQLRCRATPRLRAAERAAARARARAGAVPRPQASRAARAGATEHRPVRRRGVGGRPRPRSERDDRAQCGGAKHRAPARRRDPADRPRVRRQADPLGRGRGAHRREGRRRHAAAACAQRGRALRCGRGKVHDAHTRPVREPHHVAERPRAARGPAQRARPRARRGLDRRRRSRSRADRPRPPVDRMRRLCGQPAQVGVRAARQRVRLGNPRGAELDPRPGRLLGLVVVRAGGVPGPVRLGRHDRPDRPPLRPGRPPVPARARVAAGAAALQPAGDRDDGCTRGRGRSDPARRRRNQGATDGGLLDPVLGSRGRPAVPVAAPSHRDPGRDVLRPLAAPPLRAGVHARVGLRAPRRGTAERRSAAADGASRIGTAR